MNGPDPGSNDAQVQEDLRFARLVTARLGASVNLLHDSVDKAKRLPRDEAATVDALIVVIDGAVAMVDMLAASVRDNAGRLCAQTDTRLLLSRLTGGMGGNLG